MTVQEKERIADLRKEGYGYKYISKELHIPLSSIKSHCQRHGVTKKEAPVKSIITTAQAPKCKYCGKELIILYPGHREKKYCDDKCRISWWNSHPDQITHKSNHMMECLTCHTIFNARNTSRKYCSRKCYITYRFGGDASDRSAGSK